MALSINDSCLFDLKCLLVGNESEFVASSGENHASYCFCFSNADKLLLFWFDFGEYYSKLLFLVCILLKFHLSYFSSSQSSKLPIEILVAFPEDSLISSTSRRFTMIETQSYILFWYMSTLCLFIWEFDYTRFPRQLHSSWNTNALCWI